MIEYGTIRKLKGWPFYKITGGLFIIPPINYT